MDKRIYLCLAHMSGKEQGFIKEAFDTNWVVPLGPNVNAFEDELKHFVGQDKEVVALSAGTAAIHLGLIQLGVGAGDEVICQSFTFCASANPVAYQGAKPVFVDSEEDTWNMDPVLLEEAIKDRIAKTGKKRTQRDELCDAIDAVLKQKPKSFDGFVQALADMGFEFKDGKQPAFKGENQKRFIRLRSLGEGYSKEEIQAVISGKNLHKSKGGSAKAPAPKQFQMLIDIQAKMAEGKTVGYEKWAKKFNRKEAARTVILLKEKGLGNYDDLTAHIENLSARFDALSDSIKVAEKRMVEVQALQQHIKNYRNTRQIYIEYRKSGYSKKFFEEHRQEITIHKAAKQAFDELQITKLPSMQSLYEEFHQLAVQKKQDYAEYRQIRKEKEELLIAKRTVETILNIDRQKEQEKEKEKEEKKNFR